MTNGLPLHPFPSIAPVPEGTARPFWSIIIPVYNRTTYLADCLESVLAQDLGPEEMEVIVQDDCSEPGIESLVRSHGHGRVRYIRNDTNLGLYGNTNAGLQRSVGQWIHVLHDDDWVKPEFYATLGAEIERAGEDVGVCCCRYTNHFEPDGRTWSPEPFRDGPGRLVDWVFRIAINNPLNIPAVVIKRQAHELVGGYAEALTYTADWEFYMRVSTRFAWWYHPANLACYRVHPSNLTKALWRTGLAAVHLRKAIEMAEGYLPAEVVRKSIPRARQELAFRSLQRARHAASAKMGQTAWILIQESLRACQERRFVDEAFQLLNAPELAATRDRLGPILADLPAPP